jgi:thiamine biosynthesis lipoprotein ApbE
LSSGRGLWDGLITRPEESYRLWRVVVCDQETSKDEEAKARYRAVKIQPQWVVTSGKQTNKHEVSRRYAKQLDVLLHLPAHLTR